MARQTTLLRTGLFVLLALHLIFPLLWLLQWAQFGPRPNDWLHLKVVADHFVAGDWAHLYSAGADSLNPGYLWRYPPFALYLVAPLAWLTPDAAYAVLVGIEAAALAASLALLARLAPAPAGTAPLWVLAVVTSAPVLSTFIAGQSSALILVVVVAAAWLWTRGHTLLACALLGVLAIKPNWGLFFGIYAIAIREWRGAAAMAGVAAGFCLASWPLGLDLWIDFARLSLLNDSVLSEYEAFKVITLKGFVDAIVGPGRIATAIWLALAACVLAAAARRWPTPRQPARELALLLLFAVALNPYASFYDALVLVMPAGLWWSRHLRIGPWRVIGWLIAAIWCWEHYLYTWSNMWQHVSPMWSGTVSIVGPAVTAWILLELRLPPRAPEHAA